MTIIGVAYAGAIIFILLSALDDGNPEFRVDSLSVSNLNHTNSLISGKWDLRFTVTNPSKKIIYYNDITTTVLYDDVSLSDTTVPPFFQVKKTETARQASFVTAGAYMDDQAFDKMNKERCNRVQYEGGRWG
nr:uncharacterized protein LOC104644809 [Solanum lycopersicum]